MLSNRLHIFGRNGRTLNFANEGYIFVFSALMENDGLKSKVLLLSASFKYKLRV